ncbi:hypothetical protein OE88DRAFT_1725752 [Heliocybe sulcata]|uniref:PIN domain-containing protein n=1 Tax=Heliocybe sulcata TaxID=5364 RepID=A0A5C3N164_9AGAM|nr:hypothetical protein OE88DRAFT_1725752 [Heliocybe sulcata]
MPTEAGGCGSVPLCTLLRSHTAHIASFVIYQGEAAETMNNNKLAMSRALGAAFLNHQVEQLEKTVTSGPGTNSNNWRDRKRSPNGQVDRSVTPTGRGKRAPVAGAGKAERPRTRDGERRDKDADVVVIDASVLIHCIGQFKRWCRDERQEIARSHLPIPLLCILTPAAALNTLDLLKKGTSPLAQRARAASRILEAQVGVNPRIRVQRDDAFVLWDAITFTEDEDKAAAASMGSPEWVRRTICCARWEVEHSKDTVGATDKAPADPKVILAVASSPPQPGAAPAPQTDSSPVPLPAPQKHEPRSAGSVVAHWAKKAGIKVMEVKPGTEEEEGPRKRNTTAPAHHHSGPPASRGGRGRRNSHERGQGGGGGLVERPAAVMAMMEKVGQPGKGIRVLTRGEKLEPDTP